MDLKNKPKKMDPQRYGLSMARLKGYKYTKIYYEMKDGKPTKVEKGDDGAFTLISIKKDGVNNEGKDREAFIVSEGYIGAERAYKEDGSKRKSLSRKYAFGMEYILKYIEEAKGSTNDFYIAFLSDTEKSEKQADLFAQFIKDVSADNNISSVNMWCHSKSGVLCLRAFQKLAEENSQISKIAEEKIRAILTSIPIKGIRDTDRRDMIKRMDDNVLLKILPLSGYIKTGILSIYDKRLYKACPAQVDIKKKKEIIPENELVEVKPQSAVRKIISAIQGDNFYNNYKKKEKHVDYDPDYLTNVADDVNMDSIKNIKYKTIPVNLDKETALKSLFRHGQIMPLFLLLKKTVMDKTKNGDGIIGYEEQGVESMREQLKVDTSKKVEASHDVPTTPEAMQTIAKELTRDD